MREKEPLLLRPNLKSKFGLLLISAALVAGGIWLLPQYPLVAWLGIGFFGLGFVVSLIWLVPGSASLRLHRDGFTVRRFFFAGHYSWADVTPFQANAVGGERIVVFNFTGVYKTGRWARFAQRTTGYAMYLPCNFGALTGEALASLLNEWRNDYLEERWKRDGIDPATDPRWSNTDALPPRAGSESGEGYRPSP
jgi:hypothetical protein